MRDFFDREGKCLIGVHKGTHHSLIPLGWKEWAEDNIKGFSASLEAAKQEPEEKPIPTGRKYTLYLPGRKFKK